MFKTLGKKLDVILKDTQKIDLLDHECACELSTEMDNKCTAFMKSIGAKYISCGSCREAYRYKNDYVIKVATSRAGIDQNKNEIKFFNGSNPVCNTIIEASENGFWILSPYAKEPTNKNIKKLFGVSLDMFDTILGHAVDGNYASKAAINIYETKFKGTPFFKHMKALTKKILPDDVCSLYGGNFGIVNDKLVVIDGGLTRKTHKKHYLDY